MASGIALRLHRCGFSVVMTELAVPTTVRRTVAFSPAVYEGQMQVEEVCAVRCDSLKVVEEVLNQGKIAVAVDEDARILQEWKPDVVVDAILAKKNLGTFITDAPTVIGVGPGFTAGVDCHCVVETKRGHYLGRCIWEGSAIPNTGVPGLIGGYGLERLICATGDGIFRGAVSIGDTVEAGALVGYAGENPVYAQIDGVVRGLLQDGVTVYPGMKAGDVDPRCEQAHCFTVSDKATAIGGGVLEAILRHRMMRECEGKPVSGMGTAAEDAGRKGAAEQQRIALVLLAAGDSRRYQGNKLLDEVEGKPMYRHIVDEVSALPQTLFSRRIVVSQYPKILHTLSEEGYEAVENRESHLGISHSIALALDVLDSRETGETAVCFAVCDQPWLSGETLAGLIAGWASSGKGMACLSCNGQDGNPAVFSKAYESRLRQLTGDVGGRSVMRRFPEDVYRYEVRDRKELTDVDERGIF